MNQTSVYPNSYLPPSPLHHQSHSESSRNRKKDSDTTSSASAATSAAAGKSVLKSSSPSLTQKQQQEKQQQQSTGKMYGSVRMARNVAEKQRRDKLNSFINDLANSVPLVATATRRLDKTSILRLSAAFLRLHDSPLNVISYKQTSKDLVNASTAAASSSAATLTGDQLNSLMEGIDGFVIVVNCDFKLIYVGSTCERFLGHQNIDMLGFPLFTFLHPGDVESVRSVLNDLKRKFLTSGQLESERIQFRCRMKERSQPRTEVVTYQIVKIAGFFQLSDCSPNATYVSAKTTTTSVDTTNHDDKITTNAAVDDEIDSPSSLISSFFSPSPSCCSNGTSAATVGYDSDGNAISGDAADGSAADPDSDYVIDTTSSFPSASLMADFSDLYQVEDVPDSRSSHCSDFGQQQHSISCKNNNNNSFLAMNSSSQLTSSSPASGSSSPPTKQQKQQPLNSMLNGKFLDKNVLFKGFVDIVPASPMSELSLMDANQEEYVSRISLDGTLLYTDHRISLVLGYTPSEVIGKSAYKYILVPDHVISLFAHKLMLSSSNGTGIVVHRLRTRSGGFIYLQSAGCLQYDRYTGKVDHFVCVGRMLPEAEGYEQMQKFVRKFTPHVSSDSPSTLYRSLQMAIAPKLHSSVPSNLSLPALPAIPPVPSYQQHHQQEYPQLQSL